MARTQGIVTQGPANPEVPKMAKISVPVKRERTKVAKVSTPTDWRQRTTVSVKETAAIFGCTGMHVLNEISRGNIASIRLGKKIAIPVWWVKMAIGDPADAAK